MLQFVMFLRYNLSNGRSKARYIYSVGTIRFMSKAITSHDRVPEGKNYEKEKSDRDPDTFELSF